jgi:hypothetical protein
LLSCVIEISASEGVYTRSYESDQITQHKLGFG